MKTYLKNIIVSTAALLLIVQLPFSVNPPGPKPIWQKQKQWVPKDLHIALFHTPFLLALLAEKISLKLVHPDYRLCLSLFQHVQYLPDTYIISVFYKHH